jgi:hypothetical protein
MMDTTKQFLDLWTSFKKKPIDSSRTLDTLMEEGRDYSVSMGSEHSFSLPQPKSPSFSPRRQSQLMIEQLREIQ